jgi:adenylosuccinate lyase
LGKEIAVYLARLLKCHTEIANHTFEAKLTGAVGNFNALYAAFPNVDWEKFSTEFIAGLGFEPNLITSQILPYDNWIRYFDSLRLTNLKTAITMGVRVSLMPRRTPLPTT